MQPSTPKPSVSETSPENTNHPRIEDPGNAVISSPTAPPPQINRYTAPPTRNRSVSEATPKVSAGPQNLDGGHLKRSETTTARMTRKRAAEDADLSDYHPEDQEQEEIAPTYLDSAGSSVPSHICLCQPAPKIPRPRNAFILYRQNRHSDILAQHPNLPNPEISKIAGHRWANEPDHIKDEWKRLAAEEKARHAKQYPDYRFQPRHRPKGGGSRGSPTFSLDQQRCQKCGGRSIASAGSPSSPSVASPAVTVFRAAPQSALPTPTSASRTLPQLNTLRLDSPQRSSHSMEPPSPYQSSAYQVSKMDANKKRRYSPYGQPEPQIRSQPSFTRSVGPYDSSYPSQLSPGNPVLRRESLPPLPPTFSRMLDRPRNIVMNIAEPRMSVTSHRSAMPPPPTPTHMPITASRVPTLPPNAQAAPRPSRDDESLKLPPLQKHADPNASLETLISNMNPVGKIRVLRRTAPPLQNAINSPASGIRRGSILAVEGDKGAMLDTVLPMLEEMLRRSGEYDIKVIHGPTLPNANQASYKAFMDAVSKWHAEIPSIVEFLKGAENDIGHTELVHRGSAAPPRLSETSATSKRSISAAAAAAANDDANKMDIDNPPSPNNEPTAPSGGSTLRPRRDSSISRHSQTSKGSIHSSETDTFYNSPSSREPSAPKIPLLIIPQYLLHASDAWAAALPVTGEYGVPDHWQWVATLWRGIPGPDFVLYVKNEDAALAAGGQGEGQWGRQSEAWGQAPVEMKDDIGVMLVKQEKGVVAGTAIRRAAFEFGEWARLGAGRAR